MWTCGITASVSTPGILTCCMSALVCLDPSETATFALLNTDPVKEGDSVTMKCETDGNPQPEFDFSKNVCHFRQRNKGVYVCDP